MFLKVAFGKTVTYQQNVNPDHLTWKPPMEQVQLSKVQCRCLREPKHDFSGCSVQDCPAHNAPCFKCPTAAVEVYEYKTTSLCEYSNEESPRHTSTPLLPRTQRKRPMELSGDIAYKNLLNRLSL